MRPSSSETSRVSVPDKAVELAVWTSLVPPVRARKAAAASFAPLLEEKADQVLPDQPWAMSRGANFFEEELLAKLFILLLPEETLEICWKQFWFQSIWWGDAGNCRVIAAGFFKKKKKRISANIWKWVHANFICQPNLHGFHKIERDSPVSASCDKLKAW